MPNLDDHRAHPALIDSPLSPDQVRAGLAHHEAAHAVVAAALDVPCTRVRVMRVTRADGTGWTGATSYDDAPVSAYGLALIAAAGEHGELHHLTAAGLLTAATARTACSDHDRDTAISAARSLGFTIVLDGPAPADPDQGATWTEVSEEARDLVAEQWPAVAAVAAALLAAPDLTLTGDDVATIVAAHRR
ncbi:hypothetical protein [Streptomyces sp. CB02115]|uniref:hypothetical protein n=1 Tax=Streptomyces sp. CB02115 TaxID=1703939 RepID=UPI00093933D5|nr:hypothetical protein [Streptomyces sp. CB02115]OKJ46755.1 hypothetical protein AMK28_37510 [Streptomyces sp. CB02115]